MRKFLVKSLFKAPSASETQPFYPPAWPLYGDSYAKPEMCPQLSSPLFARLSAEIRLLIYQAALAEPYRFLHIIKNSARRTVDGKETGRLVAHYRCIDMNSSFPTWQHACYGESKEKLPGQTVFCKRPITETDDKLLSLLLTCRLIYSEALATLYQENIFHFRGSPGLLAFRASLSTFQWESLRQIHLSTFLNERCLWHLGERHWPPENPIRWENCCQYLQSLPNLHSLKLDIIARGRIELPWEIDRILITMLEPLKRISATVFEIELNVEPSAKVWDALGNSPFTLVKRTRDYNLDLYGRDPSLEIGKIHDGPELYV